MRIFWAIIVALIIVFISGLLFNILKIAMGSGSSFIGVIIQLTPFMIGILFNCKDINCLPSLPSTISKSP